MSKRSFSTPHTEVHAMIAQTFQDAFSPQWIKTHLPNPTHDLIILHHIIPCSPSLSASPLFTTRKKGAQDTPFASWSPPPSSADCANSATVRSSKTFKKTDTCSTFVMSPINAS